MATTGAPSLRWEVLIPGGILAGLAVYGLYHLVLWNVTSVVSPPKTEQSPIVTTPQDDIKPRDYTHYGPKEETPPPIPQAQYVKKEATPPQSMMQEAALLAAAQQLQAGTQAMQAQTGMMERLLTSIAGIQQTRQEPMQQGTQARQPAAPIQSRQKGPIKLLIDNTAQAQQDTQKDVETQKDSLLEPAHWIRPFDKTKVLYRKQILPGRLLTSLNSDIPGVVHIELTVPIYSSQARPGDKPLLDKSTVIIASYKGEVKFGQSRVPISVEEAQPPDGDIVELKALGGDEEGRAGVTGRVNNHYGKLALATGINAVLQLGVKSAAGTPGANQYFQNPVQQAAQEAGQSAATDIGTVVKQQLRVPPTIEKDKYKDPFVTILLEKNLSFYRSPKIVK